MKRTITILSSIILILSLLLLMPKKQEYSTYIHDTLGTVSQIRIYFENNVALSECKDYIYKMDSLLSLTNPESEVSILNEEKEASVSPETMELLKISLSYTDDSTFNPFCGKLIKLWDNARDKKQLPSKEDIILTDFYPPSLEFDKNKAYLRNPKQEINLGAIAKGYITDHLVEILDSEKIESALISLGGNIYAKGNNKNGEPWKVGVADPDNSSEYIGILSVTDTAIVTSGDYERYFEIDGKRYHHILNPKTGYPAESGLRSVTIITPNATLADMLSTKCFIAGFEKSKEILKEYNSYGIFITTDNKVYFPKELKDIFEYDEEKYEFITY